MLNLRPALTLITPVIIAFVLGSGNEVYANNGNGKGPDQDGGNGKAVGHNKHNQDSPDNGDIEDGETSVDPVEPNEVTLTWESPTTRTDGDCLKDGIAGYELNYTGENSGESHVVSVDLNAGALSCSQIDYAEACGDIVYGCSYTLTDLDADTWSIFLRTIDTDGVIGPASETVTAVFQ